MRKTTNNLCASASILDYFSLKPAQILKTHVCQPESRPFSNANLKHVEFILANAITLAVKHEDTSFHQPYSAFHAFTGHKNEPSLTGALAKFVKRAVVDQLANKFLACRAFYLLVTRFYGANDDRAFLLTMKIKHSIKHQMSSQNNEVTRKNRCL